MKPRPKSSHWLETTPIGVTVLWLAGEVFAEQMPGTALLVGLALFLALVIGVGLLSYVFHE